jgi:hypothetical protein
MEARIEGRAKAVDEGDRAKPGRLARPRAVGAQARLHRAQEEPQGSTLQVGTTFREARAGASAQPALIDGRPRLVKRSFNDGEKVKIAAIDPDFVRGLCLGP